MQIVLLKSKLHRVTVTQVEPDYEGSCAIDERLLEAANIHEYEQVHVYNLSNGERFVTYAIRARADSGIVSVNGAAAHKARPGQLLIICAYGIYAAHEQVGYRPTLVYVDAANRIVHRANAIPAQQG